MATFPTTQDVTQFLGSSIGKPVDFNPAQQSANGAPQPHPQVPMQQPPSPYMPSSGPYNPYAKWAGLMGGPGAGGQAMPPPQMPHLPMMGAPVGGMPQPTTGGMPQPNQMPISLGRMTGGPSGTMINPSMMSGMFSHMPMVR